MFRSLLPMRLHSYILMFLLTFSTLSAVANQPLSLQHFNIESWSTKDGLPHSTINAITQTADGYIWLATWEGPVRYNGLDFKAFNRKDTAELRNLGIKNIILAEDGSLYMAGVNGDVIRLNQQNWSSFRAVNSLLYDILPISETDYLVATASSGLIHVNKSGYKQLTKSDGLPSNLIYKIKQSPTGTIWLATSAGLVQYHPDNANTPIQQHYLPEKTVYDVLFDQNGQLVVATDKGVYRALQNTQPMVFQQLTDIPAATLMFDH